MLGLPFGNYDVRSSEMLEKLYRTAQVSQATALLFLVMQARNVFWELGTEYFAITRI
jgi:hypothetical protein